MIDFSCVVKSLRLKRSWSSFAREVRKLALAIDEKDNQIQAFDFTNEKHQQKILRLNKEIDDLIENRHVARPMFWQRAMFHLKKRAEKFTHITLFDVSIDSLENISDGLKFVTQTWRWLTNTTIPMLFISGIDSSVT